MTRTIVETDRLRVRQWQPDDLDAFARLATDPRVMRYIGDGQPWAVERIRAFVEGGIERQGTRRWVLWPVILKADDAFIGICGFNAAFEPDVEIGWWLAPEHWGRGLATEVARAVMEYGFRTFGFNRLISVAQPANRASIRVMEKLGMTFDRRFIHKDLEVVAYSKPNPQSAPTSGPATGPSPGLFFQTVNAFQRTGAIRAAVELDLFTGIGEGKATAAELAARSGAAERGVRILCDALAIMGFLIKREGGRYELTPDSATFLDRRSPAYAGGITEFLLAPPLVDAFARATDAVRKGGTALAGEGTVDDANPVWVKFARAMAPVMALPAELLAKLVNGESTRPIRVLDIAAGHGLFGLAFAKVNPAARVVALDWPAVVEVARENAQAAGVEDRFETIAGSAFDVDFGGPYDVVLLTNILHHFDAPTCETLLKKVRRCLAEGGRAVTLEFIPDEDRAGPPESVMFALTMLATTPAGDAYTFGEFERMFRNAGFSRSTLHELPPTMERVVISE